VHCILISLLYQLITGIEPYTTAQFNSIQLHNDHRYHLQALRHLYVLAAQPNVLVTRESDTNHSCKVSVTLKFKVSFKYS